MVQYFAVLLILCISGGLLGTTTLPHQQNNAKLKEFCENYILGHGFQESAVPQTNCKQCVWKSASNTDDGKIKDCTFNKLKSDTALKVSFQGNLRVLNDVKCNRWYFKFNGNECSGPMTIEAGLYSDWPGNIPNLHYHRSFEGYCENIPKGTVRVELWVGQCGSWKLGDAYTGWFFVSRIMIEEVSRPQS